MYAGECNIKILTFLPWQQQICDPFTGEWCITVEMKL